MGFKYLNLRRFLFTALFIASTYQNFLFAEEVYPLGLVVRPKFVDRLIQQLNAQKRSIPIRFESDLFAMSGSIQGVWESTWTENSGRLIFITHLRNLNISGDLFTHDSKGDWVYIQPKTHSMAAAIDYLPLAVVIDPITLEINLSLILDDDYLVKSLPENKMRTKEDTEAAVRNLILNKMALGISGLKEINELLNLPDAKQKVLDAILKEGGKGLTQYFQETIFGLGYGELLSKATPLSPLWRQGPLFQKNAVTLELAEPTARQREIAFAFHRFAENGIVATTDHLEFYVNARFLTHDLFGSLTGLNTNFTDSETLLNRSMDYLKNNPAHFAADWRRPQFAKSEYELSLVIPKSLTDLALSTVYKEGLTRFRFKLNVGQTTKALLSEEAPEAYMVVNINPNQAPKLDFDADRLQLDISDYSLDLGTFIEDRIIPQTSLKTRTNISAELTVDNTAQYLNLQLKPETFQIDLEDPKGRLNEKERAVFKEVSQNVWKEFLNSYSELNLFKTVINTERAPIIIKNVQVSGKNILLDLDVDWTKSKL
jgi:hypothetical protein